MTLSANRTELAVLRDVEVPGVLDQFIEAFGAGDRVRGQRYVLALRRFLGSQPPNDAPWNYVGTVSPNTRAAYMAALEEFFEWLAREHDGIVPPDLVTTIDVERYVQWLTNRTYTLNEERLRDGDKPLRLAAFETVRKLGSADLSSIMAALPRSALNLLTEDDQKAQLSRELGRMVLHRNLVRSPTMEKIREYVPLAGIKVFRLVVKDAGFSEPIEGQESVDMDDVFIYRVPDPQSVSRRTVIAKLAALSSFWETLREGENVPGGEAILQHNIITPILKRVSRGIAQESKQKSREQKPDPVAIIMMMRATERPRTLAQYRDRALLLFLLFTGVRVQEAVSLRRGPPSGGSFRYAGWFQGGDPSTVRLLRKGGRQQVLPYPPMALEALAQFQAKLSSVAAPPEAQSIDPEGPKYIPPDSPRWRYAELARRNDAPLFPSLYLWGANAQENYERFKPNAAVPPEKPLTARAVRNVLNKIGARAGLTPEQQDRIHPHALRHFAAVAMFKEGKPLNEIQEMLGHESITTTERYIQELVTEIEHSGQNEIMKYLQGFEVAPEAGYPPERPVVVVETRGTTVTPAKAAKPAAPPAKPTAPPAKPTAPPAKPTAPPVPVTTEEERLARLGVRKRQRPMTPEQIEAMERRKREQQQQEPEVIPQVEQITDALVEAIRLPPEPEPAHILPISPRPYEPPAEVILTAAGPAVEIGNKLVAVGGREAEGMVRRMVTNKSAGSPDSVYEALADPAATSALEKLAAGNAGVNRGASEKSKPEDRAKVPQFRKMVADAEAKLKALGYDPIEWTFVKTRFSKGKDAGASLVIGFELDKDGNKTEVVQTNQWLLNNYHPWPQNYGIGRTSLLPWFAKGQASKYGYVAIGKVIVPPIPVLSPEQLNPQTEFGSRVLDCSAALFDEWLDGDPANGIGPSPTRAFGLVRWFSTLSYLANKLQRYIDKNKVQVEWQPWNAVLDLGKHIRSHDSEWVCRWLQDNAHTYTTSVRSFEGLIKIRKERGDDEFLEAFRAGMFQGYAPFDNLPDWMADDDPIHALYEANPKEWEAFADWIGSVTGIKISAERRKQLAAQSRFVTKEIKVESRVLEETLREYYAQADILGIKPGGTRTLPDKTQEVVTAEMRKTAKQDQEMWASVLKQQYGIEIKDPELEAMSRRDRIRTILAEAYPEGEKSSESKNTLGDSKLFDPRYFRIDQKRHTIVHTPKFREEFFEDYKQDSELAMRRAARAMWEYVKEKWAENEAKEKKDPKKLVSSEYSHMYAVMLSYIATVIPPGEEMERQIKERSPGVVSGKAARRRWLAEQGQLLRSMIMNANDEDISAMERLPDETEEDWKQRVVPLAKSIVGQQESLMITEDNVETQIESFDLITTFAAEQSVHGIDLQRSVISELAVEGAGGSVFAPEAGRTERKEFKRKRAESAPSAEGEAEAAPEAPPVRRVSLSELSDAELERRNLVRLPSGEIAVKKLTPNRLARSARYVRNASLIMPSPFSMIRAMDQESGVRRGFLARILG
jgi:site-specific recombinase XerD